MELLLSLSKETNNSVYELLKLPAHYVLGMYNSLKAIMRKENEEQKKAEEREKEHSSMSAPSIPTPSIPSFNIPHI